MAAQNDAKGTSEYIMCYGIRSADARDIYLTALFNSTDVIQYQSRYNISFDNKSEHLINLLNSFKFSSDPLIDEWTIKIEKEPNVAIKQHLYKWAILSKLCLLNSPQFDLRSEKLIKETLNLIFEYRDPPKRMELTQVFLLDVLKNKARWLEQGAPLHNRLPSIYSSLIGIDVKWGREFRDYQNMRPLIDTLDLLYKNTELTPQEKGASQKPHPTKIK